MSKLVEIKFGKEEVRSALKNMGIEQEFSPEEVRLLEEYRNIDFGLEAVILRGLAIEAFEEIKPSYPEAILTELGVSIGDYTRAYDVDKEKLRKDFLTKMATANKKFLKLWDEKRKRMIAEGSKDPQKSQLKDLRAKLDAVGDDESIRINFIGETVLSSVLNDGWNITEDSEAKIEALTLSEIVERGVIFYATNGNGDKLDVRIAGGEVYIHVTDKTGNVQRCDVLLTKLMKNIEERVADVFYGNGLGKVSLTPTKMRYGHDESKVPSEEMPAPKAKEKPAKKTK